MLTKLGQRGFTLIEMIVAIVVLSVGLAGVLAAYTASIRGSSNALVNKQMLAIAEGMMEEIQLKPFAINPAGGGAVGGVVNCGTAGASRDAFDDVRDYNGYQTSNPCNVAGGVIPGLVTNPPYAVAVTVGPLGAADLAAFGGIPAADILQIVVTVNRAQQFIVLTGYRINYARFPLP